ncbi:acriflavin resistance protein [Lysobacteraceae bacterium NML93-0399]|nr:acriflavin resistance protein [Xanthomonadaceae bacterium NML93-0399]
MSIAELSLRRPVTTIMCFISMVVIGLIASVRLPLEALPDISMPILFVQLPYTGSTPAEAEQNLLRPAEEALATMSGIKQMRGNASADGAGVLLIFSDWDRDIAISASEAREKIDAIRGELPDDFRRYFVHKWTSSDEPVLRLRLAANVDLSGSYEMIDRQLKSRLERVPGVARVEISGAAPNEVEIAVDPDRLTAHDIGLDELATRLRTLNFSVSAGQILEGNTRLRVQPIGEIQDLQQFRELVINQRGLRLADIADIRFKPQRMDYGRRLDGRAAVGLEIYKERDANLVEVSRLVLTEVEAARNEPGLEGIDVKVTQNMGEDVTTSLMELVEAGAIGLVLSIIVLYFFLRHWPSTLMVTLAIPICFIITLGFMHFFDVTLNVLSLMGLLLAVGMLVDNAVVVVESIYQERERMPDQPWLASVLGTRHVAIALSAGTLCHCIVFVPNLLGETNQISIFMTQLAITISVSLLASWLVAVSLIPMMSARMKTPPAVANPNGLIPRMQRGYARLLRWTLQHRGWSVLGIILVVAVSFVPMTGIKFEMFGDGSGGKEIQLYYQWKGSYNLQQRSDEVRRFEAFLDANREQYRIRQLYSWFGEGGDSGTMITFEDDVGDTKPLSDAISEALPKSARADVGVRGSAGQGGGGGQGNQGVQVQLVGDSSQMLREIADSVIPLLAANPALRDVRVEAGDLNQELSIRVDRDRAAAFGFSADQVSNFIGMALRGSQLREFRRGEDEVPVWVRFAGAEQYSQADIASFMVRAPDGRSVPLTSLVEMRVVPAANRITRSDRQTSLTLQANLAGETTMPDARKALEQTLDRVEFPAGYGYTFSGSGFEDDAAASRQMMFNLLIALIMIYVVMAAVFESLVFPAAIMSCVVFSVFGVFWLFWLTGTSFTVMAFIGILVLMGVVVNNGIIMVEHINNLRRRGMPRLEALVEGSRERLRPIMMTMGTAILAMIPISLSDTVVLGGLAYSPMARAVAGGLAFSTVVSLLFLPTIYAILDDLRHGSARLIRRARGVQGPAAAAG